MAGFGQMLAKLLLDSSGFDKNIKKSKKETESFSKVGQAVGKEVAGALKKAAAAALAFKGAEDIFKAFVDSSQVKGDEFRANVQAMQTVAENFIYSLANADFSVWSQGLGDIISKAKEAAAATDQFQNTQMAVNFVQGERGTAYREAMANARNKDLSPEERKEWLDKAIKEKEAIVEAQRTLERDAMEALTTGIASRTGLDKSLISESAITSALQLDAGYSNKQDRAAIKKAYDEYKTQYNAAVLKREGVEWKAKNAPSVEEQLNAAESLQAAYEEERREIERLKKTYADVIVLYELLFKKKDEVFQGSYSLAQAAFGARNQIAEITTSTNEAGYSINSQIASEQAATAEQLVIQREKEGLLDMRGGDFAGAGIQYKKQEALPEKIEMKSDLFEALQLKEIEEKSAALENMASGVDTLSGAFSSLGNAIGGTAGTMLQFIGVVAESAATIIPLIANLYAEKAAHDANATSAVQDAAAKTLAAHAGIPFAGIAMGAALVASLVAVMQSLPMFAEGGIVTSATLGVFGEGGPEAVMPLSKLDEYMSPRELRITGEIKASGKDLRVVLNNYDRVRNG